LVAALTGCWAFPASGQPAVKNDTAKVAIKKMMPPLNTPFNDFAPVISADGSTMMFTSNRPSTERDLAKGKAGRENIYEVTVDPKKKKWGAAQAARAECQCSGQEQQRDRALSRWPTHARVPRQQRRQWQHVRVGAERNGMVGAGTEFPEPINSEEHESSACYSPDGRTIYFVSDREGGVGGKDIWYVIRNGSPAPGAR
jgi:hypothetical protein